MRRGIFFLFFVFINNLLYYLYNLLPVHKQLQKKISFFLGFFISGSFPNTKKEKQTKQCIKRKKNNGKETFFELFFAHSWYYFAETTFH